MGPGRNPVWTLEEVKRIKDRIRWDLTPEIAAEARDRPPGKTHICPESTPVKQEYFFCIHVWGCKASLALVENRGDQQIPHFLQVGIPDRFLEEAVFKAGGALIVSAWYPIDRRTEGWIRERL
ncbi:MAG: hypothetical protein JRJ26_03005 [Deltaproteobacteria bacterium]|nr:hypothetical protein [Deltaproteobacteria bacterium]